MITLDMNRPRPVRKLKQRHAEINNLEKSRAVFEHLVTEGNTLYQTNTNKYKHATGEVSAITKRLEANLDSYKYSLTALSKRGRR